MSSENIMGYTFDDIQKAQQGESLSSTLHSPIQHKDKSTTRKEDEALLAKHGMDGLEKIKFFGVIDRLKQYK